MKTRLNDSRDKAVGVSHGRRFCTAPFHLGPRYRSVLDFRVRTWGDVEGSWVAALQSECMACCRERSRRAAAERRGLVAGSYVARSSRMTAELRREARIARYARKVELAFMAPGVAAAGGLSREASEAREWLRRKRRQGRESARVKTLEGGGVPRAVSKDWGGKARGAGRVYKTSEGVRQVGSGGS